MSGYTATVEQDGPLFIASCPEVPGANGQGKTREACIANLEEAIALILDYECERAAGVSDS